MTAPSPFVVERIEEMTFSGPDLLATHDLMSPYVWRRDGGRFGLLLRVVEGGVDEGGPTGRIWHGTSDDGLHFVVENEPVLAPDKDGLDAGGCEDPTLARVGDGVVVFYSGVDVHGDGHLLWASGPDVHSLTKRGVAYRPSGDRQNVKEAEVVVGPDGGWIMGFEFADGEASRIGYADGDGPSGPWRKTKQGFGTRPDGFDSWHLSPGPMLLSDPDHPVMFYNGATRDAEWAIGWIVFDLPSDSITDRCEAPLIEAPAAVDGRRMAFAASLIEHGDTIDLYLSFNDRTCHRATLRRQPQETI